MSDATLEGLPVELCISILFSIEDLSSLKSLVFASSIYHEVYQLVRPELLEMFLHESYAGLVDIADAIATVRSRGLYACKLPNREKIIALLDDRRRSGEIRQLQSGLSCSRILPDKPANVDETIKLLHLHEMALFFLDDFSKTVTCPEWMPADKWNNEILPIQLSNTEKRRVLRAFYRLQLHSNIFGNIEISLDCTRPIPENDWHGTWSRKEDHHFRTFSDHEMWRVFFSTMAPWEVEEFGCLWEHCYCRWTQPYVEISGSLMKMMKTGLEDITHLPADEQPPISRLIWDMDTFHYQEHDNKDWFTSMGPTFLVKILREQDFITRRKLVLANAWGISKFFEHFWPSFIEELPRALPLLYPADRLNFGTDVRGLEDFLDLLPPHEQPNFAWRVQWLGDDRDDSDPFADFFYWNSRVQRWEWGFAFWDRERLTEWGMPTDPSDLR